MKKQAGVLLALFIIPCYAETIYQGIDEYGAIVFSDRPLPQLRQQVKIELAQLSAAAEQQSEAASKALAEASQTMRRRLAQKQLRRQQVQKQMAETYAKAQVAQQVMLAAEKNWQELVNTYAESNLPTKAYHKKQFLLLEAAYKKAKLDYVKTQQALAKVQNERNHLR